jgi:hypothetical protein
MGFLSVLGKLAGGLLGVGGVLGGQQKSAAEGAATQATLQQAQDRNALQNYQIEQGAQNQAAQTDLQRKNFEVGNRSTSAKQAMIGALLGGGSMQPTKIGPGGASGGLMASLQANPEALAAMKSLGSQGASAQASPLQFQGGEILKAPTMTPLPGAGKSSGFLSALAKIAQLGGAVAPMFQKDDE